MEWNGSNVYIRHQSVHKKNNNMTDIMVPTAPNLNELKNENEGEVQMKSLLTKCLQHG